MQSVSDVEFEAACEELIEKIYMTGEPLLIMKDGKPWVQVTPPLEQNDSR